MSNEFDSDPENEMGEEKAFLRSGSYEWNGKPLHPFSAMRYAAAWECGLRFGRLSESQQKELTGTGFYDGLYKDTCLVLYLCAADEIEVQRAFRYPDEVLKDAFEWADQNGIVAMTETFFAAASIFYDMMKDLESSQSEVESEKSDGEPPGN